MTSDLFWKAFAGVVVAIVGYILKLTHDNANLKNQVAQDQAKEGLNDAIQKQAIAAHSADDATAEYQRVRDAYLKEEGNDSR